MFGTGIDQPYDRHDAKVDDRSMILVHPLRICSAKEVGLCIHLLNFKFPCFNFVVYPLMRWIEPPHVTCHADEASFFFLINNTIAIS